MTKPFKHIRAFTLTEMAIVLGVIGSLAGAVWLAASDVNMTNKVRATNVQLVSIAHNIRTVFMEQGGVRGMTADLTASMDRMKAFPLEMRQNPSTDGGIIFHVWSQIITTSGGVSLGTVQVSASDCSGTLVANDTTAEPCFSVILSSLPQKACTQLLPASTLLGTGLQTVVINGVNTPLPVDSNTAAINCSKTTSANVIQWVYILRDKA